MPPLVVGLVEMNDSKTMAESPRVRPLVDRYNSEQLDKLQEIIVGIFTSDEVHTGLNNSSQEGFIPKGDDSSSYFGTRIVSILQHNPYEVMNQR